MTIEFLIRAGAIHFDGSGPRGVSSSGHRVLLQHYHLQHPQLEAVGVRRRPLRTTGAGAQRTGCGSLATTWVFEEMRSVTVDVGLSAAPFIWLLPAWTSSKR